MNDVQSNDSGVWYVQFSADVVRAMSLDQLDAAFQSGAINEATLVRQDGTTAWSRLAEIAGIEESSAIGPESIRPVSLAMIPENHASQLNDLEIEPELRPRKRGRVVVLLAAMMILGGVGFAATKYSLAAPKAAPVAAAQPPAVSPVAVLPSNLTAAISDAHLGEQTLPKESKLTDAQKKAVLEADKKLAAKLEKQLEEKRARAPKSKSKRAPSGPVFHTGGNTHDPLNSKI